MEFLRFIDIEHADQVADWFAETGGIEVWRSVDLSDLGSSWITPLNGARPHWKAESSPSTTITDPNQVGVTTWQEVNRFRVGIRPRSNGLGYKVTDGGTRRIRRAVDKAGEDARYTFDYSTQEAVIVVPSETISLAEYVGDVERFENGR